MPDSSWVEGPTPAPVPLARRLAAALLLAVGLLHGALFLGGPIGASWREADTHAMARNLRDGGFDLLRPQVDWRGGGDGGVECEFPLYQGLVALTLDAATPPRAWPARLLTLLAMLGSAALWFGLLERRSGSWAALAGTAALLTSAQFAYLATRVLPDGTSLWLGLLGLTAALRYGRHGGAGSLWLAALATGLAVLAKPTTAQAFALAGLWLCAYAPRRLREPRLWLAAAAVLAALAWWLWHARQLGLQSGLTFGVTFGDTKAPHLAHLLRPRLYLGAAWTSLQYGISPVGAAALGWLVWRRRFDRGDAVVLGVTAAGVLGSLRYSCMATMGPHYHLFGALAGAWFVARAAGSPGARWLGSVLGIALAAQGVLAVGAEQQQRAASASSPTVALGAALQELVPPDGLLVVRGPKPRFDAFWARPNNYEEPVLFHRSGRRGLVLPADGVDPQSLAAAQAQGCRWFVDAAPDRRYADTAAWLAAHAERVLQLGGAEVFRLSAPR